MVLIWDGATYHKSGEIKGFLAAVNQGKAANEWELTYIFLGPNCSVA